MNDYLIILEYFFVFVFFVISVFNLIMLINISNSLIKFYDIFKEFSDFRPPIRTNTPRKANSNLIDINQVGTYDARFQTKEIKS
jgi:hypothetical protein